MSSPGHSNAEQMQFCKEACCTSGKSFHHPSLHFHMCPLPLVAAGEQRRINCLVKPRSFGFQPPLKSRCTKSLQRADLQIEMCLSLELTAMLSSARHFPMEDHSALTFSRGQESFKSRCSLKNPSQGRQPYPSKALASSSPHATSFGDPNL